MLRRLALALVPLLSSIAGCALSTDGSSSDSAENAVHWNTEAEVQTQFSEVITYFRAHAKTGSFVSSIPAKRTEKGVETEEVRIAYAIVEAAGPEKGGVLLVSGRTESYSNYMEVAYDLSRQGYTVYMADHRGQGHSSRLLSWNEIGDIEYQKGYVANFHDYVADLTDFVLRVVIPRRAGRTTPLFGLGHSMGGAILTLFAEEQPKALAAVALSSPMMEFRANWFQKWVAKNFGDDTDFTFVEEAHGVDKSGKVIPWDVPFDSKEDWAGNKLTHSKLRYGLRVQVHDQERATRVGGATLGWARRSLDAFDTIQADATKIQAPVVLLQATEDKLVGLDGQTDFCDAVNKATPGRCTLVKVDGSEHEGLNERDPIRNLELNTITSFFTKHTPATAK